MLTTKICYKTINHSHCFYNVWSCRYYNEHQTSHFWWDISFLSISLLWRILEDNFKSTGSEAKIGLQSCILKRQIFLLFLSQWIYIPRYLFASSKFFIPNSLANCALNSWTRSLLEYDTNMSSTYNNKIMKSLSQLNLL